MGLAVESLLEDAGVVIRRCRKCYDWAKEDVLAYVLVGQHIQNAFDLEAELDHWSFGPGLSPRVGLFD